MNIIDLYIFWSAPKSEKIYLLYYLISLLPSSCKTDSNMSPIGVSDLWILSRNGEMQLNSRTEKCLYVRRMKTAKGQRLGIKLSNISCAYWDMKKCD